MYSVGIDIGGMSVKGGVVKDGRITLLKSVKTVREEKADVENIIELINSLLTESGVSASEIKGIGVGCPGTVDSDAGVIDILPNLGWKNVPLAKILKGAFGTKVKLTNDANAAALGEAVYGAAKGYSDSATITLGTGVGSGIIVNGKILDGYKGKGAEIGHTTLIAGGKKCSCGRRGCAEQYLSATALIRQTKTAMKRHPESSMWSAAENDLNRVDGKLVFDCAKSGDPAAKTVVENFVAYLSEFLMNVMNIFRPQIILIGGGVSAQKENLTERVKEYCSKYHYGFKNAPIPVIATATLGNDAGIIGAAELVK